MKYQKDALSKFPDQIRYALENYQTHLFKAGNFDNIILAGLGGSGIAGRIAKSFLFSQSTLPIEVISDYDLPKYAGKRTLAIMSSYSGNTEETLSMYKQAKEKGCTIVAITTGGELEELATADGFQIYKAEPGFQPRMALGYSLTFLMLFMGDLFGVDYKNEIQESLTDLQDTQKYIDEGEKLFKACEKFLPRKMIVVTDHFSAPVGLRLCQQLQENAKMEAFLHELPEANHNVIETYYGDMGSLFLFLDSHAHERTQLRFQFLSSLLHKNGNHVFEVNMKANNMKSALDTIYILDWLSLWMADFKKVDSKAIANINALKDFLAKS
jgi:glucose/mannose-6-phosphate isomerase